VLKLNSIMLISEPLSISQISVEEQNNIKLLIFCLTSLQYCYFLSHFYPVIETSENEKITDVFKLFRRYDRNASVKKTVFRRGFESDTVERVQHLIPQAGSE